MALHRASKEDNAELPRRARRKGPGRHTTGVPLIDFDEPAAAPIQVTIVDDAGAAVSPFDAIIAREASALTAETADDRVAEYVPADGELLADVIDEQVPAAAGVDADIVDEPVVSPADALTDAPIAESSPYILPDEDIILEEPDAIVPSHADAPSWEVVTAEVEPELEVIEPEPVDEPIIIEDSEPAIAGAQEIVAPAASHPVDDDVIEPIIDEPSAEPPAGVVVAEMVLGEVAPVQPESAGNEVHIHHHYHEQAEQAAPQIIIAPPPIYMNEWPTNVPVAPIPQAREPRRPGPDDGYYDEPVREYVEREEAFGYLPEDARPKKKRGKQAPAGHQPRDKEPVFVWRGKPIGRKYRDEQPQFDSPRAIEAAPAAAAPRSRPVRVSTAPVDAIDGRGIDTASWFDRTVAESIERGVSDLHIRVEDDGTGYNDILTARVRIDGRMRHLETISGGDARLIINRFKTASELSTNGSYVPEESVYEIDVDGDIRKARVALFRTANGGDALVLRLPPAGALRRLEDLNFAPHNQQLVNSLLHSSNRMILIAGPMGSGKTTTAHACLQEITTPERSVWSLEDPVERDLPNVTQLEVDEENGAGFDALLPVLVRSDYDTLFLGEIRDNATAAAGVRQAKAGRQVITTIHANDNVTALLRLIELAKDSPLSVLDSVVGVISQRLVGRLNPDWDGVDPNEKYKGRVPIHEVLTITPELTEAIMRDTPITEVQKIAAEASTSTFLADGYRLVADGVTDRDEVFRVLGRTEA